jgi:hypothetical protein
MRLNSFKNLLNLCFLGFGGIAAVPISRPKLAKSPFLSSHLWKCGDAFG